jgi:hypothetical protein
LVTAAESPVEFEHSLESKELTGGLWMMAVLGGVPQAEVHEEKLEQAEWSGHCGLLYVVGMDRNLVVGSHQVDFGKDGTAEKLVGVVVDVTDGVAVENGAGVQRSAVAVGTPSVVLLGHDVKGR